MESLQELYKRLNLPIYKPSYEMQTPVGQTPVYKIVSSFSVSDSGSTVPSPSELTIDLTENSAPSTPTAMAPPVVQQPSLPQPLTWADSRVEVNHSHMPFYLLRVEEPTLSTPTDGLRGDMDLITKFGLASTFQEMRQAPPDESLAAFLSDARIRYDRLDRVAPDLPKSKTTLRAACTQDAAGKKPIAMPALSVQQYTGFYLRRGQLVHDQDVLLKMAKQYKQERKQRRQERKKQTEAATVKVDARKAKLADQLGFDLDADPAELCRKDQLLGDSGYDSFIDLNTSEGAAGLNKPFLTRYRVPAEEQDTKNEANEGSESLPPRPRQDPECAVSEEANQDNDEKSKDEKVLKPPKRKRTTLERVGAACRREYKERKQRLRAIKEKQETAKARRLMEIQRREEKRKQYYLAKEAGKRVAEAKRREEALRIAKKKQERRERNQREFLISDCLLNAQTMREERQKYCNFIKMRAQNQIDELAEERAENDENSVPPEAAQPASAATPPNGPKATTPKPHLPPKPIIAKIVHRAEGAHVPLRRRANKKPSLLKVDARQMR